MPATRQRTDIPASGDAFPLPPGTRHLGHRRHDLAARIRVRWRRTGAVRAVWTAADDADGRSRADVDEARRVVLAGGSPTSRHLRSAGGPWRPQQPMQSQRAASMGDRGRGGRGGRHTGPYRGGGLRRPAMRLPVVHHQRATALRRHALTPLLPERTGVLAVRLGSEAMQTNPWTRQRGEQQPGQLKRRETHGQRPGHRESRAREGRNEPAPAHRTKPSRILGTQSKSRCRGIAGRTAVADAMARRSSNRRRHSEQGSATIRSAPVRASPSAIVRGKGGDDELVVSRVGIESGIGARDGALGIVHRGFDGLIRGTVPCGRRGGPAVRAVPDGSVT